MAVDSAHARIDQYLAEQQLTKFVTKVLPLTGDASDRRYFRVLLEGPESIVLALHAGASISTRCRSSPCRD